VSDTKTEVVLYRGGDVSGVYPMTKMPPYCAAVPAGFDPERVTHWETPLPHSKQQIARVVFASDYDCLLALYRDLKAREAFHGF